MAAVHRLVLIGVLMGGVVAAGKSGYSSGSSPYTPFPMRDFSHEQLPLWSMLHPKGSTRRTTNAAGNPLPSNTASLTISKNGPLLMDHLLLDKLASFTREKIPERIVHAQGQGAYGYFVVTNDVSRWTKAKVFNTVGKSTKTFVRFSSTFKNAGAGETLPDPRGFAIRFYTEDGNLDFAGFQFDVLNVRDPMTFPDSIRAFGRNPQTNVVDKNMAYDFLSMRPEGIHSVVKFFADNGRPGSMRAMNGSSVNSYRCVNEKGEYAYCKFWWDTWQNIPPLNDLDAVALAGTEPDFYTKDLYNAIAAGNYPKWTFGFQIMTQEQADALPYNPFDVTKVWRFEDFPFIPIGTLVLDKNPTDFFTEVEQVGFNPGNLVPGIAVNHKDRVLAARTFAYKDAQRYRLGPNFEKIEVNRPVSRVDSYERDGAMRSSAIDNGEGGPVYFPNSFNGPRIDPATDGVEDRSAVSGYISRVDWGDDDNYIQPRQFLQLDVGEEERGRIAFRIAVTLSGILPDVRAKVLVNCIYPLGKEFGDLVVRSLQIIESRSSYNNATVLSHY